ncbi:MAG: response regulator [Chloroflexi bacterium]|nr:response regulator [Chloroflexota bacterium]
MIDAQQLSPQDLVLAGGGDMGARMRAYDWAATPVGAVEAWPQSLRTAVSMMLASGYPMLMTWGPQFVQFYNDAYAPVLGAKHPEALGQTTPECWSEIWESMLGPMFRGVMDSGVEVSARDLMFPLQRHGFIEESYFDFSYSPIRDESYQVGGILVTCSETTARVLSERRLRVLHDLAEETALTTSPETACAAACRVLGEHHADVPFSAIYLADLGDRTARLAGCSDGIDLSASSAVDLRATAACDWPLANVWDSGEAVTVSDVRRRFGQLPSGGWPEAPECAMVLPLGQGNQEHPTGLLIAGVSPRLALNGEYESFLRLVAGQIGTAIANAIRHEEERQRADALAELDRAKTAFFSNISHEFRTPLSLLLGPLEDALAEEDMPPGRRDRLEIAQRNGMRLLKLVNSLLDFSRIEAGRVQAVYELTDLASYTSELASNFRSAMERAGLRFVVECGALSQPVYVDREMWEKIVLNLLSNALKFTFEGEVRVSLTEADGQAVLGVRDSGTGIAEDELPHIFERFHRVEGARARTQEGSGIGLALVWELVRLHGGTIGVHSRLDEGTEFTVSIPCGTAHLPADRVEARRTLSSTATSSQAYVEEATRWLDAPDEVLPSDFVVGEGAEAVGSRRYRLLVADDNADMRQYLQHLLGQAHDVDVVADGEAALRAVHENPPDLLLTDVMMPKLGGFALLEALRNDPATELMPVIMLSARAGEESRVEGLEAGADDYLIKPFTARELLARVRSNLQLAELRQRARIEAEDERQRMLQLFEEAPAIMCLLSGPEHVFAMANAAYQRVVGDRQIVGKRIREAMPEIEGQGYFEMLDQVYREGKPVVGKESLAQLARGPNGEIEDAYFDFIYAPFRGRDGEVEGVFVHGFEVTAQVLARRNLEQLAADREAALKARDEFLSIASHELRTPVTGIKGSAQLLMRLVEQNTLDEVRLRRFLENIREQSDRLATLTQDLLDVSRVQSGQLSLARQVADFVQLVRERVSGSEAQLGAGRIELQAPDAELPLSLDRVRLGQVIANLLQNAAKYSPPDSKVTVRVVPHGDGVLCEVMDRGIGIPGDEQEKLFQPFGRASNALERPGMGLGLYICRQIVEQHGGRIWVSSDGEQQGTTVSVWLPARE